MFNTDWELIQACRRGSEPAWQEILDRYKRLVFSIPLNYGLGENEAADIMQLTFMMLMQSLDRLHEESHLGGWLATVARRNTWHLLNRLKREDLADTPIDEDSPIVDENSQREQDRRELLNWLLDGLSRIDETCRAILIGLYLDPSQPSYRQVAARLGLAVGSIGPMRAACLRRLRAVLSERS